MPPVEPNDEERLEQISPDEELPFTAGDSGTSKVDDTRPETDTDMDLDEFYNGGPSVAEEPNKGNTVESYDPNKDHRKAA